MSVQAPSSNESPLFVPGRSAVHRAGRILRNATDPSADLSGAIEILSRWRALHSYPINTFQAYLRKTVKRLGYQSAIIAQRLKRFPSIVQKLNRYQRMGLETMQDIGGIRVILKDINEVNELYGAIRKARFKHEPLLPPDDYIKQPKFDGYRSLHQVFRYWNNKHPELNVLHIELQIRTRLQHAWATAVETLGMVEQSSFKTGEGSEPFKQFFKLSSALFSIEERTPILEEFSNYSRENLISDIKKLEYDLQISAKLKGIAISAHHIAQVAGKKSNGYHLMELDIAKGNISLIPFTISQIDSAEDLYKAREHATRNNPNISVVLISAGNAQEIKKAYPNYFLDTNIFIKNLERLCNNRQV